MFEITLSKSDIDSLTSIYLMWIDSCIVPNSDVIPILFQIQFNWASIDFFTPLSKPKPYFIHLLNFKIGIAIGKIYPLLNIKMI